MYLRYIRHKHPCGTIHRGTLYSVHFQPNEKGGYNETLTCISDAYELASVFPPALIYPVQIKSQDGRLRLVFGMDKRYSMLHLIDREARELFFAELRSALKQKTEVRIEIATP